MHDPRCNRCQAPVRFIRNVDTGNTMILDFAASPKGNVAIVGTTARVLGRDDAAKHRWAGAKLYIAHQATCPAYEAMRTVARDTREQDDEFLASLGIAPPRRRAPKPAPADETPAAAKKG